MNGKDCIHSYSPRVESRQPVQTQKGMLNESGCSLVGQLLFIENDIIHDYATEEGMSTGIIAITKQAYKRTHR